VADRNAVSPPPDPPLNLVVFSDDWGRHPSSSQHLVAHLMRRGAAERVLWVNTIGTRRVRPTRADARRVAYRLQQTLRGRPKPSAEPTSNRPGPGVISPLMWPGFRAAWQRRLNARQIVRAVRRAIDAPAQPGQAPPPARAWVGLTTLPITADVIAPLRAAGVDRWVYYCVDDFSVWPGLDGDVMDAMERELVGRVDATCAVSKTLVGRLDAMLSRGAAESTAADAAPRMPREGEATRQHARSSRRQDGGVKLLTHGVELEMWRRGDADSDLAQSLRARRGERPVCLFWGLIDDRFELDWLDRKHGEADWVLVGPAQHSGAGWDALDVTRHPARPHRELPAIAAAVDVLIMPYRDLPVTRAMQPLKLLEYLATDKPVVVRRLPATEAWADCCDVVETAEAFVRACRHRAATGLPETQRAARARRLPAESWSEKSRRLEAVLRGTPG
jgi:hypothetical protein